MDRLFKFYITILILLLSRVCFSQSYSLNGVVTDSLQNPLPFTNVLAKPTNPEVEMAFSIADEEGRYKLILEKGQEYLVSIRFLGYRPYNFKVKLTENSKKNIQLKPSNNELDEVIVISDQAVRVREDTITYKTDVFKTGEERKLRQVLKKLPGVEVDKKGGVTVNGKKVNKLLVDGKDFFGGGTKLGVENIPADAVDEVEVIDNYNEIGFLKGLSDSDKMAMNIKLKKGKKKFAFGDIEAGSGTGKHYLLHPNLFYYSPKTAVNFIGDLNDIGVKSFTIGDYLNFEGGIGKLFTDPSSYFSLQNDDLSAFLRNQDFKAGTNRFAAGQVAHTFFKKLDFSAYSIFANTDTETETQSITTYITDTSENKELKSVNSRLNNQFLISKLSLDYAPNSKEDLSYSGYLKTNTNNRENNIKTISQSLTDDFLTFNNVDALTVKQNMEWHKKLSVKHTFSTTVNYFFNKNDPKTNWLTNKAFLPELLPLIDEETYNINQIKNRKTHNLDLLFKYYWVLNNTNHIYTTIGNNYLNDVFSTYEFQKLQNGDNNDFEKAGFGNELNFSLNDLYFGLQHKFKLGIATVKYGASLHHYYWKADQKNDYSKTKNILLPDFLAKIKISASEKINLRYNLKSRFSGVSNYANRMQIQSYSTAKIGNEQLENELYHAVRLWYTKFSMYRGIILNASISYNKKLKGIKNETVLSGINRLYHPILLDHPEDSWMISAGVRKSLNKFTLKFNGSSNFSNYTQILNTDIYKNKSNSHRLKLELSTNFKKWPNLDIGYSKRFNKLITPTIESNYTFDEPYINLEYNFLNDFYFKADYMRTSFKDNTDHKNIYEIANAELEYHREDSMWSFKIKGTNILGVDYKNDTRISGFITSENRTYILPRIWLFTIVYKI
ncbi:MAG: carboxypeptidase-like regulatory domain-containing protein [Bacteroidetes bacterium]|nr:MAG: carboxypeptidase-like regulatory domain-containing protein [Bacteroidota bacterium]